VVTFEDGTSIVIGGGARWMGISKVLDENGLTVSGGINSAVGVGGGLTLGGKHLLFTNVITHNIERLHVACPSSHPVLGWSSQP
jgi:hypothetical protein